MEGIAEEGGVGQTCWRSIGDRYLTQVYQLFLSDKTTPDDALVNMTGVPPDYHEFTNVFSKTHASATALHQPYDLKIELEEGTSPPFGPIYSLSQSELRSLQEFLDEHLVMDFICPSHSLGRFKSFLLLSQDLKVNLFGLQQDICSDGVKYAANSHAIAIQWVHMVRDPPVTILHVHSGS